MKVAQSYNSLQPHGLYSPWNSPGQNTGVGSLPLFHRIFLTQRLNPGLPHYRQILYWLSHSGSPRILEWVAYPFSSRSSQPRNGTRVSCIAGGFFTNWAIRVVLLWWMKIKTRPLHNHTYTLTETKALPKPQEWPNILLSCLTRLTTPLSITKLASISFLSSS